MELTLKVLEKIPDSVRSICDPFSRDLVYLWDARYMKGLVILDEIEIPGKVCRGYILLQESKKDWTIRGFFVDQQCRNRGIGSKLLEKVDEIVSASKKKICYVNITEGAEDIYLKHGFTILGRRSDFPTQFRAKKTYD